MLLGVPNVSEGRDRDRIAAIEAGFASGAVVLDLHADPVHNRSVFTLAGEPGDLARALLSGARAAVEAIDMRSHEGAHPRIGALDVCPVVWLQDADRDPAFTEARATASAIAAELEVPVFLYGELAVAPPRRERAYFREGGLVELERRMRGGELSADRGPDRPHPTAGATLVAARPPLVAFNLELDTGEVALARAVAARLRESGKGLPGVRAIGLALDSDRTQVSVNVHDPQAVPLARVVDEVRRLAGERGARPVAAELVGLAPRAALARYPDDVPLVGFDPRKHLIEERLGAG